MNNVLIDSDVILDLFFDRIPFSEDAAQIISLCEQNKMHGFVTPAICSNIYYLLNKISSHERVIRRLSQLLGVLDVLKMDKEVIVMALHSGFKDFDDALQHFAAVKHQSIDIILTRNIKDYKKSEIAVMTPNNFIRLLATL